MPSTPDDPEAHVLAASASTAEPKTPNVKLLLFPAWLGWVAAACFALTTGYFATQTLNLTDEVATRRDTESFAQIDTQDLRQQLEAERLISRAQIDRLKLAQRQADIAQLKITSLASPLGHTTEAQAIAVWNPVTQAGVLDVSKLPALTEGKDYQLWIVDPQYPNPVDGGVFQVAPASGSQHFIFKPRQPVQTAAKFAVSLERQGGVPKAEGPMVLLSQ